MFSFQPFSLVQLPEPGSQAYNIPPAGLSTVSQLTAITMPVYGWEPRFPEPLSWQDSRLSLPVRGTCVRFGRLSGENAIIPIVRCGGLMDLSPQARISRPLLVGAVASWNFLVPPASPTPVLQAQVFSDNFTKPLAAAFKPFPSSAASSHICEGPNALIYSSETYGDSV